MKQATTMTTENSSTAAAATNDDADQPTERPTDRASDRPTTGDDEDDLVRVLGVGVRRRRWSRCRRARAVMAHRVAAAVSTA